MRVSEGLMAVSGALVWAIILGFLTDDVAVFHGTFQTVLLIVILLNQCDGQQEEKC